MKRALVIVALAACGSTPSDTVVGPFTGAPHRFVVDAITLPITTGQSQQLGEDLDGDGVVDNQLGQSLSVLASVGDDVTTHAADMIASGVLASSVTIDADDLANDDRVGIEYEGVSGVAEHAFGGKFVDGVLRSNRSRSSAAGEAVLRLPVFVDADPIAFATATLEIDLVPDATGYVGTVRGGISGDVVPLLAPAILQMLDADPGHHLEFASTLDSDHDGQITAAEIAASTVVAGLTGPDLVLHGEHVLSFGFQIHLLACETGACIAAPPADHCSDRSMDTGNETGIDCGGDCKPCPGATPCMVDPDCQSNSCDTNHVCVAPSCTDGVTSGYESAPDCGGIACPRCAAGAHCALDSDCASAHCDATSTCAP